MSGLGSRTLTAIVLVGVAALGALTFRLLFPADVDCTTGTCTVTVYAGDRMEVDEYRRQRKRDWVTTTRSATVERIDPAGILLKNQVTTQPIGVGQTVRYSGATFRLIEVVGGRAKLEIRHD